MTSEMNIELLETALIDFLEQMPEENWIFQQNNAAIHTSGITHKWFRQ